MKDVCGRLEEYYLSSVTRGDVGFSEEGMMSRTLPLKRLLNTFIHLEIQVCDITHHTP